MSRLTDSPSSSGHLFLKHNADIVHETSGRPENTPVMRAGRTIKTAVRPDTGEKKPRVSQRSTFGTAPRFQETFITSNGLSGISITGRNACHATQGCSKNTSVTRSIRTATSEKWADKHLDHKTAVIEKDLTNSSGPNSFERTPVDMKALREISPAAFDPEILDGGYGSTDTLSNVTDIEDFEEDIFEDDNLDEEQLEVIRERWKAETRELLEKIEAMRKAEASNTVLPVELINQHHRLKQRDDYKLFESRFNQDLPLFMTSGSASMQVYRELNRLMNENGFDKSRLEDKASKEIFDILWDEKIITMDLILSFLRPAPGSSYSPVNISKDVDLEGSPFW
ncbi:hypothetical protein GV64_11205 [Endozoicomonas elysicola]|uniref:Uncharacterized protein n=2 Tax=Endozoicomonas elysicola TaxID=305900 RepID=A0A081KAQ7_9GAMM|nr:hypothetical protein GV64_11205 [Endozoicomonas elysicola]